MKRKELTSERAQELANELGLDVCVSTVGRHEKAVSIVGIILADFTGIVNAKKSWPYPRATDADKGKAVWFKDASMEKWAGPYVFDGKKIINCRDIAVFTHPAKYRLADPDNLTQPPPGLED